VVDFAPNTAIVATGGGKYIFKPTGIRVVEVKDLPAAPPATSTPSTPSTPAAPATPPEPVFGSITGILSSFTQWYSAEVTVVPSAGGSAVATTTVLASSADPFQGEFSAFVPGGTYRVHVYAQGFAPYSSPITTVRNGAETSMGIVDFIPVAVRPER